MLFHILDRFKDDNWPLFGTNLWFLRKWGLWLPRHKAKRALKIFLHCYAGAFVVTQYIELYLIKEDHGSALKNLSVSLLSTICMVKSATFIIWQEKWRDLITFANEYQKREKNKNYEASDKIIEKYTNYCRKIDNLYAYLIIITLLAALGTPLILIYLVVKEDEPYPEMMSAWLPIDKGRGFGYVVNYIVQTTIYIYGGGIVWSYDTTAFKLFSFFTGQLNILKLNCAKIFGEENKPVSKATAILRLKECHTCHCELMKYTQLLNSLLTHVLFLYVIVCSLMICASAIQLTSGEPSAIEAATMAEYLLALIFQLFLYSWHSNEVTFMSQEVDYGVFSSRWYNQDVQIQRHVLIFKMQLKQQVLFMAGPFSHLNVATFLNIMKGAYSYYTLLTS